MVVIVDDDDVALFSRALLRVIARGSTEWWYLLGRRSACELMLSFRLGRICP